MNSSLPQKFSSYHFSLIKYWLQWMLNANSEQLFEEVYARTTMVIANDQQKLSSSLEFHCPVLISYGSVMQKDLTQLQNKHSKTLWHATSGEIRDGILELLHFHVTRHVLLHKFIIPTHFMIGSVSNMSCGVCALISCLNDTPSLILGYL